MNIARAIDLLEDIQTGEGTVFEVTPELAEAARMAIEELAAEGWIPVEERLPKKPEENPVFEDKPLELCLVSVKNEDYALRAFWNGTSFTDGWSKLDVIAWMPLPEPYKPEN